MKTKTIAIGALALVALLASAPQALAAGGPAWKLTVTPVATNFVPGENHGLASNEYFIIATNVGGGPTSGSVELHASIPAGVVPTFADGVSNPDPDSTNTKPICSIVGQTVECESAGPVLPSRWLGVMIRVEVPSDAEGMVTTEASIGGGGASEVKTVAPTKIEAKPPSFDFIPGESGFGALLTNPDGSAATQAGSHPGQFVVNFDVPIRRVTPEGFGAAGHLRSLRTDLPPGMVVNPSSTPVLCTEAQLESSGVTECPPASQVGVVYTKTSLGSTNYYLNPLYNMAPPPGVPAMLGFEALGVGIPVHLRGEVRSDGDYGLSATASDTLAFPVNPVLGATALLWGDPTDESHDRIRGICSRNGGSCPTERLQKAFLAMPTHCSGPIVFSAAIASWEEPGVFHERSVQSADPQGNPVGVDGCNALEFEPSIEVRPTTNVAESPTGLDFDLHQTQDFDSEHLSTAALKDLTMTLPEGMTLNPSAADGIEACSSDQVGLLSAVGQTPIRIGKEPSSCPDASKIGTLEVTSPALAQHVFESRVVVNPETEKEEMIEEDKLQTDPETGDPIPDPVFGSVYLAKPFDNPFGSLLAIYLAVEDEKTGIVAKVPAKIEADPNTGQLVTKVSDNPQLPLEDVKVHLFGGARASLITPPLCGTHTTTTTMTPWSAPEGVDAHPSDSFAIDSSPSGGTCPTSSSQAPNSPSFTAGTTPPLAGAFAPFALKLSRNDGSQRLSGIQTTLPPGLIGKLAGVGQCSEAQIAQAKSREKPNLGVLERQSPSCPASSEVGTVDVGAGAGPTPFYVKGHVYLAGPYKGAPLSLVVITPAVAGPFDLGAVAIRAALQVDPDTAQIHAISDPLPSFLQGIPLDLRSVALNASRSQFTLNPTSCNPMAVTGSAISSLGASASLTSPFQVGGCKQLPFKPKLSLKLKGGTKRASHPKLIATLKAKPGEANIASAQVKLPPSAFLDQAHIRTICTRVQFAADTCPKGSIYGEATATTPLLDQPLSGNVYLRSSSHKLPDLVVALKGPAFLPIEIDLDGKTDSVKGSLRNTFEAVPDAPVSTFRLELFGGKRGLVVNSRNICAHAYKAEVDLTGQNGKAFDTRPVVGSDCKSKGHKAGRRGRERR